ncbi:hypothetical protein JCM33774_50610 [Actinophytocola sp. KF-1]
MWFCALACSLLGGAGAVVLAIVLAAHGYWLAAGVAIVGGLAVAGLLHVTGIVAMFLAGKGTRPGLPAVVGAVCGGAGLVAAVGGVAWGVVAAVAGAEWTAVRGALGGLGACAVLVAVGSGIAHRRAGKT